MRVAVAGLSVRMMAEAVARGGDEAIALDVFGDVDTRRSALAWHRIGRADRLAVDDESLMEGLLAARRGGACGWVAGSGFEARPDLLDRGAALLPLFGTRGEAQRRLRDPASFFGTLAALAVTHPETRVDEPQGAEGWLAKDGAGSGGWQVFRAADAFAAPSPVARYWQREVPGMPMSATFLANGSSACVLGFNRLLTRRIGMRPHVFRGVIGPVPLDEAVSKALRRQVDRLAERFALRGLCSLDFMLEGRHALVLEINARPPGSLCLYSSARPALMRAHVRASMRGRLPAPPRPGRRVHGHEIGFATRDFVLDEQQASALAARADCHDLPVAGSAFRAGDPVCSVTAGAGSAERVADRLRRALDQIATTLEPRP